MAITQEMVLLRLEDLDVVAEARTLVRRIKEKVCVAEEGWGLFDLHGSAVAVSALVAEALRAFEPGEELRRLRETHLALDELRVLAWECLSAGQLSVALFDELMTGSTRCRHEVNKLAQSARRRARVRLEQP
jgi:hypothetical protein